MELLSLSITEGLEFIFPLIRLQNFLKFRGNFPHVNKKKIPQRCLIFFLMQTWAQCFILIKTLEYNFKYSLLVYSIGDIITLCAGISPPLLRWKSLLANILELVFRFYFTLKHLDIFLKWSMKESVHIHFTKMVYEFQIYK